MRSHGRRALMAALGAHAFAPRDYQNRIQPAEIQLYAHRHLQVHTNVSGSLITIKFASQCAFTRTSPESLRPLHRTGHRGARQVLQVRYDPLYGEAALRAPSAHLYRV
eukprot:3458607-Prymnesium_polylepis.1